MSVSIVLTQDTYERLQQVALDYGILVVDVAGRLPDFSEVITALLERSSSSGGSRG